MLLFISCANETNTASEALPNTPEAVVRTYQAFLDKNEFEKAKQLSTEAEKERLDAIFTIISTEPRDSTIFSTVFLEINCSTEKDKALCACLVEDFEEKYRDTFHLVKLRGQWLIDATKEVFNIESDIMFDDFIKDMMNEPSDKKTKD
jgi:predicted nucleic acid-binding protein